MSVAASRWAVEYLAAQPPPHEGGPSRGARATLLALAIHAGYPPHGVGAHVATISAGSLALILGRAERHVRDDLTELERLSIVPVVRRPGRAAAWHFLIAPMSTTPDETVRGPMSTTPDVSAATPDVSVRRRDEGDVLTSTDAVPRGEHPVRVTVDHVPAGATWDDYYAPVMNDGAPWSVQ